MVRWKLTNKLLVSWAVLACLFVYVWWFSANALWLGDDIYYRFIVGCATPVPVSSFGDIVDSQIAHYSLVNGRFEAHFLAQAIISFMPQAMFALLNAVAYVVFVFLMVKIGLRLRRKPESSPTSHPKAIVFASLMTLTCILLRFVPTTAMYVWMYDIVLSFLYVLLFVKPKSFWLTLPLFLFSFLAGAAHESINTGLAIALFVYGVSRLRRLSVNEIVMLAGFAIGLATIVLAPATGDRMDNYGVHLSIVFRSLIYVKATIVLAVLVFIGWRNGNLKPIDFYRRYSLWVNAMVASLIVIYFVVGISGARPHCGVETIAIVLAVAVWPLTKPSRMILAAGALFFAAFLGYKTVNDVRAVVGSHGEYERLKAVFAASDDGKIVEEFSLTAYPSRLYEIVFASVQEDFRSTDRVTDEYFIENLSDRFNLELGTNKTLRIVSPIAERLESMPDSTQVIAVPLVDYIVVSKSNPPSRVVAKMKFGPFALSDNVRYPTDDEPLYATDKLAVYPCYTEKNIAHVDTVIIEP